MKYYIFKSADEANKISYGFIPEDKISEESKEFAFKVLDALPKPIESVNGDSLIYRLSYNEETDVFFWEITNQGE